MSLNNTIVDSDWSTPQQHGSTRLTTVFDGDNSFLVLEEDYVQEISSFTPLDLNHQHASPYGTYYLVKESALQPIIGDMVKWTRTYAQIPATRSDYSTVAYRFIGYAGIFGVLNPLPGQGTTYTPGRPVQLMSVPCEIVNEYFMVGTGGSYPNPLSIPINLAQKYYQPLGNVSISGGVATFTPKYTPGSAQDIETGIPTDFLTAAIGDDFYFQPIPTTPTRKAYETLRANGTQIIIEDSSISRWMGNIYCRVTKKVIAR